MANNHIITKTYKNLKGFSTDSTFSRPPYVAEDAINIYRYPDTTFAPRRGFQCDIANIGGMGNVVYDVPFKNDLEIITLNLDGNLYRRLNREIRITFSKNGFTSPPNLYFEYSIFTDPRFLPSNLGWSFAPWSLSPWGSPSGESITFQGFLRWAATSNGVQSNVTTLVVDAGHVVVAGDVITLIDKRDGTQQTRLIGSVGATTLVFDVTQPPVSVDDNQQIDIQFEQFFRKGFDVASPYPISQFITYLNSIGTPVVRQNCILAYATGITTFPAAFIPIQEISPIPNNMTSTLTYNYWEIIPSPSDPLLPGSASQINQNSLNFENATFAIFEEDLYCSNGYDFPVKYDGQNAYLAGMPEGDRPTAVNGAGGTLPAGSYTYAITYEQIDNTGRLVEGVISAGYTVTSNLNDQNTLTIIDLLSNSGYNTDMAVASGGTATVYGPDKNGFYYHYVAVNAGYTLKVGDTGYYKDNIIAQGNTSAVPLTSTRIPVNSGYGVQKGDIVLFTDNSSVPRQRFVLDIDTTVSPNVLELSGAAVTVTDPPFASYRADPIYGDIAIANGNQTNVTTLNVLAGHTIQIGDEVFFEDVNGNIQIRDITGVGATTITYSSIEPASIENGTLIYSNSMNATHFYFQRVNSSPIVLSTNAVISNNLRINIYRIDPGSTLYKLVATIPNNSNSGSITFIDNYLTTELIRDFTNPDRLPNPPPKAKYIMMYENTMIYAGGDRNPTNNEFSRDGFYFSEGNQPESVPRATNFQLVPANNDEISGVGISGSSLVIMKDFSIYVISGELLTSNFEVVPVAPGSNIGCAAHATIKSIGGLLYFLSNEGVFAMSETQLFPSDNLGQYIALSTPIDVIFRSFPYDVSKRFVLKRAIAINYTKDYQYLLFLPCEDANSTIRTANINSRVLCFDYQGKNWFTWTNINAAGGFLQLGEDLYWQERRFSAVVGNTANLYRQHRHYRLIDQADHTQTISVLWSSSWEDLEQPEIRKKFIRCMLLIDRIESLYQFNQPFLNFQTFIDRFPTLADTQAIVTTVDNSRVWGRPWSWTKWSGLVDTFIRINLRHSRAAKSLKIQLQMNSLNTSFRFIGFQLEIAPDFMRSFLR